MGAIFKNFLLTIIISITVLGLPIYFLYPTQNLASENYSLVRPLESEKIVLEEDLPVIQNSEIKEPVSPTPIPTFTPTPFPTKIPVFIPQNRDYTFVEVTKTSGLGTYAPSSLIELPKNISKRKVSVAPQIVNDLTSMINAATADQIDLKVVSGYRSYSDQSEIFQDYYKNEAYKHPNMTKEQVEALVNTYSAYPGFSEHQLGTTVDVLSIESNYSFNTNENMKFVKWLEQNASKYNFRISYPKNNGEYKYEPWHLRWWPK